VTVGAPGFGTRTVFEDFNASRKVTIRVYRPELQWPMYGATPDRAQTQSHIRLRPPFRTVWSIGLGTLIEFPAVRRRRGRVHRQLARGDSRDLDALRPRAVATRHSAREDGIVARWSSAMSSSTTR